MNNKKTSLNQDVNKAYQAIKKNNIFGIHISTFLKFSFLALLIYSCSPSDELAACKDTYNWLQKKIDKEKRNDYRAQYRAYQGAVMEYYQMALNVRRGMQAAGQKPQVDKQMMKLCEDFKIDLNR